MPLENICKIIKFTVIDNIGGVRIKPLILYDYIYNWAYRALYMNGRAKTTFSILSKLVVIVSLIYLVIKSVLSNPAMK